jgi:nucleotide-binding universal stress UspA family protein
MTSTGAPNPVLRQRLVVGFDGSESSRSAMEWAAAEAETRGASVRVISSYFVQPVIEFGSGASGSVANTTETGVWCLNRLRTATAKVFDGHPGVEYDAEAVRQSPAAALLAGAKSADLVVVGSSGAGMITRFLLGSVSGSLLASSPCPVVVVPAALNAPTSRIVVGTDGSEHADHAVRWAADEADRRRAELVVAHIWKYSYHLTIGGLDRADDFTPVDAELILDKSVEAARSVSGGDVRGELIEGNEADTLLELSTTADLLVLGSRGRGGFRAMLFGSIASAAATHSSCPTVLIR